MADSIQTIQLPNGLTLLMQQMPWLESAAMSLLVPAGSQRDPEGLAGLAGFTAEMVQRGCGQYNSRQFVEQLDRLGHVVRQAAHPTLSAEQVKAYVAERTTSYKHLAHVEFVEAVPKSAAGKILRKDLQNAFVAGQD